MKEINKAYEVLGNEELRKKYDVGETNFSKNCGSEFHEQEEEINRYKEEIRRKKEEINIMKDLLVNEEERIKIMEEL
jgi:curved DNA-binding protein CbpA